jgi:aminoglycoside phosphotransferase (APT) family kinase protein
VDVIDLDRSRPGDPARDVAEFLHRLRMTTFWDTGSVKGAEAATDAFLAAYRAATDVRHLTNLRFHSARYVFHSFNHKVKSAAEDGRALAPIVEFYRSEFDRAIDGRFTSGDSQVRVDTGVRPTPK